MAKKIDPLKAKQKKQKIMIAVGSVILLGLLAFEVPSVMKHLNQKPPPGSVVGNSAASTATPSSGAPSLAAPTLSGADQGVTTTVASADGVTTGDGAPPTQDGQLASFSRFQSKDPFAQQIQDTSSPSASTATSSGSSGAVPSGPSSGSSGTSVPTGTAPAPGTAVISVNGTLMNVTVGADFPASQSLFHLVSLAAHTAKISIVGGSYASGAATVTLRENKPVTLMNTADGTRYKLVLKPQGTAVPGATSTTPTSTTPASTTPTP